MIIKALYDGVTEIDVETFDVDANFNGWNLSSFPKDGVVPTTEKTFPIESFNNDTEKSYLGYSNVLFPSVIFKGKVPTPTNQEETDFLNRHTIRNPITHDGVYSGTYTNLKTLVSAGHYVQFSNCRLVAVDSGIGVDRKIIFEEDGQEIEYELPRSEPNFIIVTVGDNFAFLGRFYSRTNSQYYPDSPTAYGFNPDGVVVYGYTDLDNFYNMYSIMNWSKYFGFSGVLPSKGNPFGDQSTATTGGGNGSFDFRSDVISAPTLPQYSALSTKMITCLVPTNEQMTAIASKFWSDSIIDALIRIFSNNPLDSVITLTQYPFKINSDLTTNDLAIGGVSLNVPCNATTQQFMSLDFGTLDFTVPLRDNYLDYEPYTNIVLHLPYVGDIKIDCCDVWRHVINVRYFVDILTGSCMAYVFVDDSLRYTKTGNCATNIPLTGRDVGASAKSLLNVASNIVGFAATGNPVPIGAIEPVPPVSYKNVSNNSLSLLESNTCYLAINTANESVSSDLSELNGFRSNITNILANVHGYTEVISTHVENIIALDSELNEIDELLKGGVILP